MTRLLGGSLEELGWSVHFVEAVLDRVAEELMTWRREIGQTVSVEEPLQADSGFDLLPPLERPWTRELLLGCGAWTAYLNSGGDATASAQVPARRLGVRHVLAEHAPPYGPGHASTQLWLSDPDGTTIRTISAVSEDGRWKWLLGGQLQPFEQPERYEAGRVAARFDKDLLLEYLFALGIDVRDETRLGPAYLVRRLLHAA